MDRLTFMQVLGQSISKMPWFSLFAIPFAAIPAGIASVMFRNEEKRWIIHIGEDRFRRSIPYVILGLFGGFVGEFVAVTSLVVGEWWECYTRHFACYDGQGGIALIITVPLFSLFGSSVSLIWTRLSLRVPTHLPWASVFIYAGNYRLLNLLCAVIVTLVLWALTTACAFTMFL